MTMRLHFRARSGHAHRAQPMLSLLGLPFERIDVDLPRGEYRQPRFLPLNAFGQVPAPLVAAEAGAVA